MSTAAKTTVLGYALGAGASGLALWLGHGVDAFPTTLPLMILLFTVVVVARFVGLGPAWLATALSAVGAGAWVLPERGIAPASAFAHALTLAVASAFLAWAVAPRRARPEAVSVEVQPTSEADGLERFTQSVSHDLVQPLAAIMTYGELLRDATTGRPQLYATQIIEVSGRMAALLRLYLDHARASAVQRVPTSLDDVINRVERDLRDASSTPSVAIRRSALPVLPADADLLYRLFHQLVSDALRVGRGMGSRLWVTAECLEREWLVTFGEETSGAEAETTTKFPVAGIGMAICRRIVELHGGRLWVEPEADRSATVRFTLPDECTPARAS